MSISQKYQTASGDSVVLSTSSSDIYLSSAISIPYYKSLFRQQNIKPRFRVFVLNPDETIRYPLPNERIQEGGSYSENYQDGQRRTMSLTLFNEDGKFTPSINSLWIDSKFSLELGIEMPNGQIVWNKKGIYVISNSSTTHSSDDKTVPLSLGDKFNALTGKLGTLETTYEIPIGSDIEEVIKGLLNMDKGNGYVLDPKPIIYHSSFKGKKTQTKISKSAGSTVGEIILELGKQLSAEVFYNVEGNVLVTPTQETSSDIDKPVLYDFKATLGDMQSVNFDFNMSEVINRVIVTGTTQNGAVHHAIAVNDDTSSPLCYQRIGYRTGSPINDSNITSDLLAQERAKYELRKQLILKSSVNLPVTFNPLLLVNNLVTITDEFYGLQEQKFLIQSISCNLGYEGMMSISVSNLQNLPFLSV